MSYVLNIVGEIGKKVTADSIRAELTRAGSGPITVKINSSGGSVQEGVSIYESLRSREAPVTVEVVGWALSIASVIAMAGNSIRIAPTGLLMLHNPWMSCTGNAAEMRKTAETLDVVRNSMLKAYTRCGQTKEQILSWLDSETWFDSDEAIAYGLADGTTATTPDELAGMNACAFQIPDRFKEKIKMQYGIPQGNNSMSHSEIVAAAPPMDPALAADMARRRAIRSAAGHFARWEGASDVIRSCEDDPRCSVEQANKKLLDFLGSKGTPIMGNHYGFDHSADSRSREFQAACADVLLARAGIPVAEPHPAARDVQRLSIAGMAEQILSMHGRSVSNMSKPEVIQAALSTSDFPELLTNTTGRALRAGYENAPTTHAVWTAEREVPDFKPQTLVSLSEAPGLEKVGELGEYKFGSFSEAAEAFVVETFGKIINISRQALVNDDLGGFTRMPQAFGASARRLEADHVYAKLTGNANLSDGVPLFHADHGNLGAAAALSVDALGVARAAMRKQKGIAGIGYFDPQPRYLIVPVSLETKAEALLASLADPASANSGVNNPAWVRGLTLVADPRLDANSATAWYLAADPNLIETMIRAYLAGEPRPYLEENSEFVRDAISHKCRMDFGVGVIDYRGLYKNPGQ